MRISFYFNNHWPHNHCILLGLQWRKQPEYDGTRWIDSGGSYEVTVLNMGFGVKVELNPDRKVTHELERELNNIGKSLEQMKQELRETGDA